MTSEVDQVRRLAAQGEHFAAINLARQFRSATSAPDKEIDYLEVLSLARSASTSEARVKYMEYGLQNEPEIKFRTLPARLLKDEALSLPKELAQSELLAARDQYLEIHKDHPDDTYTAINAATLSFLGGDGARSDELATRVLSITSNEAGRDYWYWATRSEALIILGRLSEARQALQRAMELPAQRDDVVSTLRQLELLCTTKKLNSSFLDILKLSPVVHYWGEALEAKELDALASKQYAILIKEEIREKLAEVQPISLFGNLNPGLDLLIAEVALSQGVELNIVIPHPSEIYLNSLEDKLPQDWLDRTRSCLERATNVELVDTQRDGCFSDVERLFATRVAMGKASLRARAVGSDAIHLSFVANFGPPSAPLSSDPCNEWTATGRTGLRVKTPQLCGPRTVCNATPRFHNEAKAESPVERVFMFADVKGFSSIGDRQMPIFVNQVLGTFQAIQDQIGDDGIEFKNTWGDGVFLVFSDVGKAARYALTCQQKFRDLKDQTKDLPEEISVRIGLHAGTAWRLKEPITGKENYFGNAVSKAARIEPVTQEGQLFASEQCAALLELSPESHIVAEYVGQVETPKGFGTHPLYKLVRNFSG